jgi:thiol-disulfide isomerase/thioredoxin
MDAVLLTVRCLLAAVFLLAAFGKLFDLTGARRALQEFGVPGPVARPGSVVLPVIELTVAVALVIRPSARAGAAAALVLLTRLHRRRGPRDGTGARAGVSLLRPDPFRARRTLTLIRNAVFAAAAVFVLLAGSGPNLVRALGSLDAAQLALVATSILAAALALVAGQLWGDKRRLERELAHSIAAKAPPGLARGTRAPDFALTPVRGITGSLSELMVLARPAVLVFLSTSCGPCLEMLPALARWQQSLADTLMLTAIFSGEAAEVERLSQEHELEHRAGPGGRRDVHRLRPCEPRPPAC